MKLQLEPGSIRIRIGEAELAVLQRDGALASDYALDGPLRLRLHIRLARAGADAAPRWASMADNAGPVCMLRIADHELAAYVERLPCKQGLDWSLDEGDGTEGRLSFEVDVRDSIGLRGPRGRR